MKRIIAWGAHAALLCAGLLFVLVLAEVARRVMRLGAANTGVFSVTEGQFQQIPGIWGPGQDQLVLTNHELPFRVRTNRLGYRGPDFTLEKPEGQFRSLYLGDSFVFGHFVDDEETVPAQLEASLRRRCSSTLVVNAGLGGSTITEHTPLMERGLVLAPDIVVLQFSENDVADLAGATNWEELRRNRQAKSSFPMNIMYPVVRSTAIWGLLLRARAINADRKAERTRSSRLDSPAGATPESRAAEAGSRREYAERLARFAQILEKHGHPMLFAVYPSFHSVYGTQESDQIEWVTGLADSLGIRNLDLTPALQATGQNRETLYLMPHDGHASPRGNEIAGRAIAQALFDDSALMPACD